MLGRGPQLRQSPSQHYLINNNITRCSMSWLLRSNANAASLLHNGTVYTLLSEQLWARSPWRAYAVPSARQLSAAAGAAASVEDAAPAVMLVESPAKAKKIQEYLGPDYQVIASYGHIRDLPAKTGSVVPEEDFSMTWELADSARPRLDAIAKAVAQSSRVVLATDPDREGEAISWHLVQELERRGVLPDPSAAQRVTFNEVTRPAVLAALAAPRELSKPLVDAYMARRALDYLFGFNLSPLLWRKLPGARSAGRVQSVALRLVAEREAAIEAFVPQPYWSVHADVALPQGGGTVRASLVAMDGGPLPDPGILEESVAQSAAERIAAAHFTVTSSTSRQVSRQPSAPFTTSTMQQEASTRLGLSAARTMQLAQKLYEAGHITYMRTDGVSMAAQAVQALRGAIEAQHGAAYLPDAPRFYASKAKNAQEAHEAIRPTNPLATPEKLHAQGFESGAVQLYRLIRARAMASQMANSKTNQVTAEFESDSGDLKLRATASHTVFPGFTAAYARAFPSNGNGEADEAQVEGDPDGNSNGNGKTERSNALQREAAAAGLAALQKGESVSIGEAAPEGHTTRGPPRFTEGTLVKSLEELGVGRPSTYAPTMKLLQARKYVHKEGRALHAEPLGRVLSAFLCAYFPTYVDYEFTSRMEAELDEVSGGQADWKGLLNRFWGPFHEAVSSKKDLSGTEVIDMLNEELSALLFDTATGSNEAAGAAESGAEGAEGAELLSNGQQTEGEASLRSGRTCPSCGNPLSLKMSHKGGPFVGCTTYPHCSYTRPVGQKMYDAVEFPDSYKSLTVAEKYGFRGPVRLLGEDPNTGSLIFIRHGQYGPYVQLGLDSDTKMRRVPLPKNVRARSVLLDYARSLLLLPRTLGANPETGEVVEVRNGKFGPYVLCGSSRRSLPKDFDPLLITLDDAMVLLEAASKTRAKRESAKILAEDMAAAHGDGQGSFAAPKPKTGRKKGTTALKVEEVAAEGLSRDTKGKRSRGPEAESEDDVVFLKPRSGYQFFLRENMTGTTGSTKGRMAAVRDAWHALSDAERQIYQDKAASDKRRYELQRSGLLPGDVDWENMPPEDKEHFEGLMRERRALLVELASGAAAQIKRPNSPFVIFVREKGKELRGQVKGNFLSAMSAAWRNLSPTERLPYEEVAEEEQLLYKKQREMMLKTVSVKGPRPVTVRDHDNSKYYGG